MPNDPYGVAKRAIRADRTGRLATPSGPCCNPLQARQLCGSARIMAIFYKNATPAAAPTPAALSPATVPEAPQPCFAR